MTIALALLGTAGAGAQERNEEPGRWWFDGALGYGSVRLSSSGGPADTSGLFHMSLAGGRVIHEQVWIGLEAAGWLYEASTLDNPGKGEGLSEVGFTSRFFLAPGSAWHAVAGAGYASHWNNAPGGSGGSGGAWSAGIGYDWTTSRRGAVTLRLLFGGGSVGDEDFRGVTLDLGYRWR